MSINKIRQEVERAIITAFVEAALAKGYRLSVSLDRGYDLEEGHPMLGSTDLKAIVDEAMAGDDAHVFVHTAEGPLRDDRDGRLISIGWVYFVLGNDGWDVVSDYTANAIIEGLMVEPHRISDRYSD